ncbi:hypothetical protein AAFF_G00275060 [Aldrovandia affinis]|uniref:Uncharacterized protein n=1 Tax=Aldrovandia affinis TaxID=143900 RepID=A0AAD7SRT7_9TELE|nr:hypothetical protein AAFF_G00275060 [Aldrovandia affinis]
MAGGGQVQPEFRQRKVIKWAATGAQGPGGPEAKRSPRRAVVNAGDAAEALRATAALTPSPSYPFTHHIKLKVIYGP